MINIPKFIADFLHIHLFMEIVPSMPGYIDGQLLLILFLKNHYWDGD